MAGTFLTWACVLPTLLAVLVARWLFCQADAVMRRRSWLYLGKGRRMQQVPKEHARQLFRVVLRNADLFGEFRVALSELKQGESPYMWLAAQAEAAHEARVLVTESRILVFRVRVLRGSPLEMVGEYPFQSLSGEPALLQAGRRKTFHAAFDIQGSHLLVLGGLPATLAEQLKTFAALPSEQRVLEVHQRAPELPGPVPTRRGLPSREPGADHEIDAGEDSGEPTRIAAPATHGSAPEEVVTDGEQTPIRPHQDQAAEPVHGISREEARELFDSVERNVGFFGEFCLALRALQEGECPYMWLVANVQGVPESRLLLTNRRLLLFRVRLFRSPRLLPLATYDLGALGGPPVTAQSESKTSIELSFVGGGDKSLLNLGGLSPALAEKIEGFLALAPAERTVVAREKEHRAQRDEKDSPAGRGAVDSFLERVGSGIMDLALWGHGPISFGHQGTALAPKRKLSWSSFVLPSLIVYLAAEFTWGLNLGAGISLSVFVLGVDAVAVVIGHRKWGMKYTRVWIRTVGVQIALVAILVAFGHLLIATMPELQSPAVAVDAGTDILARVTVLVKDGDAYASAGRNEDARSKYQAALDLLNDRGSSADKVVSGDILLRIGTTYESQGEYDEALSQYRKAYVSMKAAGNTLRMGSGLVRIGDLLYRMGRSDEAYSSFEEASWRLRGGELAEDQAAALCGMGVICSDKGEYSEALDLLGQAMAMLGDSDSLGLRGSVLVNQGVVYCRTGSFGLGIATLAEALDHGRETGNRPVQGGALYHLGTAYFELGELDLALAKVEEALVIYRDLGDALMQLNTLVNIAVIHEWERRPDLALANYLAALEFAKQLQLADQVRTIQQRIDLLE